MNISRRLERLERSAQAVAAKDDFIRSRPWAEWGGWLLAALDAHRDLQAKVRRRISTLERRGPVTFEKLDAALANVIWPHHGRRQPFVRRLESLACLARRQGWLPPAREPTEEELRQMYEDWAEFYFEETGERAPSESQLEAACCTTAEHEA